MGSFFPWKNCLLAKAMRTVASISLVANFLLWALWFPLAFYHFCNDLTISLATDLYWFAAKNCFQPACHFAFELKNSSKSATVFTYFAALAGTKFDFAIFARSCHAVVGRLVGLGHCRILGYLSPFCHFMLQQQFSC